MKIKIEDDGFAGWNVTVDGRTVYSNEDETKAKGVAEYLKLEYDRQRILKEVKPVAFILLNAGMSGNGNSRKAYLVMGSDGCVMACIRDTGRGIDCLRDKFPNVNCFTELKTTATEIKSWERHCEDMGKR